MPSLIAMLVGTAEVVKLLLESADLSTRGVALANRAAPVAPLADFVGRRGVGAPQHQRINPLVAHIRVQEPRSAVDAKHSLSGSVESAPRRALLFLEISPCARALPYYC